MYSFGEAWFLTSLILNDDWSSLEQVMAIGDGINHAIFTKNEINSALTLLIESNYVDFNDSKLMRATRKALEFCDFTFLNAKLLTKIDIILNRLNNAGDAKSLEIIEFFLDSDIKVAYEIYLKRIHKKLTKPRSLLQK